MGPYTSIDPNSVLQKAKYAHLAVRKEFDLPLDELASGADPSKINNFIVKDLASGAINANAPRPLYKKEILDQFSDY